MAEVMECLQQAGAQLCDIPQPESFVPGYAAHRIIMRVEAAAVHDDLFKQHRDLYRPHIRSFIESGMVIPGVQYVRAQRLRRRLQRELAPHLAQVDALLTPTTSTPAPYGLHATGDPALQMPWTFLGIPALTLPSGLADNGLPLGVQLASAPFTEARLLAVARWCERRLGFTARPALVQDTLITRS